MPEGDTVWRTAHRLHRALAEQTLTRTDLRVPCYAALDLAGQPVHEVVARGKHLLHRVGADTTIHTHLKMEGSWHLYRPGSRWRRPAYQARLVLHTRPWVAVGFDLGGIDVVRRDEEAALLAHLGPDLLGPDWDVDEALRRLRGQPGRPVAEALLDQRNLAGASITLSTGHHCRSDRVPRRVAPAPLSAPERPQRPSPALGDLPGLPAPLRKPLSAPASLPRAPALPLPRKACQAPQRRDAVHHRSARA